MVCVVFGRSSLRLGPRFTFRPHIMCDVACARSVTQLPGRVAKGEARGASVPKSLDPLCSLRLIERGRTERGIRPQLRRRPPRSRRINCDIDRGAPDRQRSLSMFRSARERFASRPTGPGRDLPRGHEAEERRDADNRQDVISSPSPVGSLALARAGRSWDRRRNSLSLEASFQL